MWLNSKTFKPIPFFDALHFFDPCYPFQNFDPRHSRQNFMDPRHPRQNFNPRHLRHLRQNFMDPRYPRHPCQTLTHANHAPTRPTRLTSPHSPRNLADSIPDKDWDNQVIRFWFYDWYEHTIDSEFYLDHLLYEAMPRNWNFACWSSAYTRVQTKNFNSQWSLCLQTWQVTDFRFGKINLCKHRKQPAKNDHQLGTASLNSLTFSIYYFVIGF